MERIIKGIFIPIEIWQSRDLSWNEKVLLMEIDSFTSKGMDCYFSNAYIADLLGVKEDTASKLVSSLIKKGYIKMTRFDGRSRYLETCISFQCRLGEKSEAGYDFNHTQTRTNIIDNNISNKQVNKDIDIITSHFVKPSLEDIRAYCKERGNSVDPETFYDFYQSKGWKVGNQPMKDWKAAVRTWEKPRGNSQQPRPRKQTTMEHLLAMGREMYGTSKPNYDEQ